MNPLSKKFLPGVILSLAILISACSFSTSSTPRRNATYASAAQTSVSQEVSQDVTNQQLATDQSALLSPTNLPTARRQRQLPHPSRQPMRSRSAITQSMFPM